MKVIAAKAPGGPDVLRLEERPDPTPAAGEVLIAVAASGLNGADLAQREGNYPPPKGASDIIGLEVAGTVIAVGDGVSRMKVGDRVCALLAGGGYASECAVAQELVLPLPDHIGFVQGAALAEALCTVWMNVFDICALKPGQTLLVHGGSSGIGTAAIQLAKMFGARVWTTAGSPEKVAYCLNLGADRAVDYRQESFLQAIQDAGEGVDVLLDIVGGSYFEDNLKCLNMGGRICVIAFKGGRHAKLDLGRLMIRNLSVRGTTLRSRSLADKAAVIEGLLALVWPAVEDGRYKIVVDRVFRPEEAGAAHSYMESGAHKGKIVIEWSEPRDISA